MNDHDDEFFIGYLPKMPSAFARVVRASVVGMLITIPLAVAAVALVQEPVEPGVYEYGIVREYRGVLRAKPVLHLVAEGDSVGDSGTFLLVGFAKSGVPRFALEADGKRVTVRASLVEREGRRMLELGDENSVTVIGDAPARADGIEAGHKTIRGELIDTKCFYGAMRPAVGKVHRACAIRCLGAGIPPAMRVVDAIGAESIVLLAGRGALPLELDIELAGRFVEASGELELHAGIAVLRVDRLELDTAK